MEWEEEGESLLELFCFLSFVHIDCNAIHICIIFDINDHVRPLVASPEMFCDIFITRMTSDWGVVAWFHDK